MTCSVINVALVLLILLCLWAVISSRVHTGVIGTIGLTLVAIGCGAALDDSSLLARAFKLVVFGGLLLGVSVFGSYLRTYFSKRVERRQLRWPTT